MVGPGDERPHRPDGRPGWEESWYFDFIAAGGQLAGFVRLTFRPAEGRAWWWTSVVGPGRMLVTVREHDIDVPRGGALEVRASGLWAEPVCETPFDHWSLGLEAFALGLEDPAEAYGAERGDPVPLGLDLEWEALGPPVEWPSGQRYGQACTVSGDVLVGSERLVVTGTGAREHAWGPQDWTSTTAWAAGALDDGLAVGPGPDVHLDAGVDERGLLAAGRLTTDGGLVATVGPLAHAPVQVPGPHGGVSRVARALCRLETADGRRGRAWAEQSSQPASRTTGP